jgi:acetyl esterase/lipase
LAPEHPFPAAIEDVQNCYLGLIDLGIRRIAITGDAAGGCLALVLLSLATNEAVVHAVAPVGAVVLSPLTDLVLTGPSWWFRAEADPYFTRSQAVDLIHAYLGDHHPSDPLASPIFGDLTGLPPIRVQVGEDEVLFDDSRRYVKQAVAAGIDARLDVWEGMTHGFHCGIGCLAASVQALDAIGAFLIERLTAANS